jgi:probable phosphomutase (TIGR03848 family)
VTRFLLIRHGHTGAGGQVLAGRAQGIDLDARGREQAEGLVSRLEAVMIDTIFVSPLARTRQTAEPLARVRNLKTRELSGLHELDYGEWQGARLDALTADPYWSSYNAQRSLFRIPGGELLAEAQLRMVQVLEQLHAQAPGTSIALFGHGDPIRALLAYLLGMPLDHVTRLEVAPASVSVVQREHANVTVVCVNHVGRIAELGS